MKNTREGEKQDNWNVNDQSSKEGEKKENNAGEEKKSVREAKKKINENKDMNRLGDNALQPRGNNPAENEDLESPE